MSFIDMTASHRWTEADIVNRTEAMIAAEFPPSEVAILVRIVSAANAGMYTLTNEEMVKVARYNEVCLAARQAGDEARADMALLAQVLDYEQAQAIKAHSLAAIAREQAHIADADLVLDAASADVLELVAQRAPAPEPEQDPIESPTMTEEADQ